MDIPYPQIFFASKPHREKENIKDFSKNQEAHTSLKKTNNERIIERGNPKTKIASLKKDNAPPETALNLAENAFKNIMNIRT